MMKRITISQYVISSKARLDILYDNTLHFSRKFGTSLPMLTEEEWDSMLKSINQPIPNIDLGPQENLGNEFEKILHDNLSVLYVKT